MDSVPTNLDKLTRKIMKLEIEKEAIKKEKDELSKKRKEQITNELKDLKQEEKVLTDSWNKEKELNKQIKDKKEELDKTRFKLEQAENTYDLETAARLRHGIIPKLEQELENLKTQTQTIY